jgi:hypothetical protein
MATTGNLRTTRIAEVVRRICVEQRMALLVLRRQVAGVLDEGVIYFGEGTLHHAKYGTLEGEGALKQLLRWQDGVFEIFYLREDVLGGSASPPQTIQTPWRDFLTQVNGHVPSHNIISPPVAQALIPEEELMHLLASLEHNRTKMTGWRYQRRPVATLTKLAELVNRMVMFTEYWVETPERMLFLETAILEQEYKDLLPVDDGMLNIGELTHHYKVGRYDKVERRQQFMGVAQNLVALLNTYCQHLAFFAAPQDVAPQWRELGDVYEKELAKVVGSVKF